MKSALVPLAIFLALAGFLFAGLGLNPREVPSPLVGKPAPNFELPVLGAPGRRLGPIDFKGRPWLLNVWASWCVTCRDEHPVLLDLAQKKLAPIVGLNYKDREDDALRWLARFGDPFEATVVDAEGRVGIDYGVYGVPETYVIDRDGVIRHKHIGPLTPEIVERRLVPLLKSL
ncbi:MAG: DsbE family thiol:disulfide interchange protein [Burkholderiales bacterium]|nr:DsbE family thiol:disulfide interchange protein [Burkholderiales bacterium]